MHGSWRIRLLCSLTQSKKKINIFPILKTILNKQSTTKFLILILYILYTKIDICTLIDAQMHSVLHLKYSGHSLEKLREMNMTQQNGGGGGVTI